MHANIVDQNYRKRLLLLNVKNLNTIFYHIPCAIRKGLIFDINFMKKYYHTEQIPFYCSNHCKKIQSDYKKNFFDNQSSEKKRRIIKIFMKNFWMSLSTLRIISLI